jgi:hypothetical protein
MRCFVIVDRRGNAVAATPADPPAVLEDEGQSEPIPAGEAPTVEPMVAKGTRVEVVEAPDDLFSLPPDEILDKLASLVERAG